MTTLGRHLFFDYPEYYNLFSRVQTDAGIKAVANTNRRFLNDYRGADGIKTGYTRAAGFNLVASAERGSERIIATVFGGRSTTTRNNKVAELLDLGFKRAPTRVATRAPQRPAYQGKGTAPAAKTIRVTGVISKTQRPTPRPTVIIAQAQPEAPVDAITLALKDDIESAMLEAVETPIVARPFTETEQAVIIAEPAQPSDRTVGLPQIKPEPRIIEAKPVVVTRLSAEGTKAWGVSVGAYNSRYKAERVLLKTALAEMTTLDGTQRTVYKSRKGYEARFMKMNKETAEMACRRLSAREASCAVIAPS
jgi:D-alanyl-D-alanine carboxypeptidase